MLWSVIFKYHLELEHHNEAYAAIVHNPDKTRRENCLRHFIITLCDRGLFHEICTYPYVNLQEEVYITLWAKLAKKSSGRDISDSLDALPPAYPFSHGYGNFVYAQSSIVDQLVCVDT